MKSSTGRADSRPALASATRPRAITRLGPLLSVGWGGVALLLAGAFFWRAHVIGGARFLGPLDYLLLGLASWAAVVCWLGIQGRAMASRLARKLAWVLFFVCLPLLLLAVGLWARSGHLLKGAVLLVPVFCVFAFAVVNMVKLNDDSG